MVKKPMPLQDVHVLSHYSLQVCHKIILVSVLLFTMAELYT